MNVLNKIFCFRLFNFTFIGAILFLITACESEFIEVETAFSDLEVYVSGTLSGNPRSGLKVAIYDTEEDAINEVNALTFPQNTNSDGFAFFRGLEPGYRYWVRVDTTLIHNINRTQLLDQGFNEMSMTIL